MSTRANRTAAILLGLIFALGPVPVRAEGEAGAIRGTVVDADLLDPLPRVRVQIPELGLTTMTTPEGSFLFESVPAGTYSLQFGKDGYTKAVRGGIVVVAGRLTEVEVQLAIEVIDLPELVVTGEDLLGGTEIGLMEIRQLSVTMEDSISSEIISKTGASDVAGIIKLVTGTSIVDGKYATVRGMSDRYTGTTLNGVRIPSADPRRRAVQLDLFPTGTVESVTVTKTFTPDLQGDFTGGGVDIVTKAIPDGRMLNVSLKAETDTIATGNDEFLSYVGGGVPATGFSRGSRALPSEVNENMPLPALPTSFTTKPNVPSQAEWDRSRQFDTVVRAFDPTMGTASEARNGAVDHPGPNLSFGIVGGDRWELDGHRTFGLIGGLTYSHKYFLYLDGDNNQGAKRDVSEPEIELTRERSDSQGTDELLMGALLNLVGRWGVENTHEIGFRAIGNQATQDEARYQEQRIPSSATTTVQNQSLHYQERSIGSLQLNGQHRMSRWSMDWIGAFNFTRQDEPDVRFFRNELRFDRNLGGFLRGGFVRNSTPDQNTRRIFRDITEDGYVGAVNFDLPFQAWGEGEATFQAGLFLDQASRQFAIDSFSYEFPTQAGSIFDPIRAQNANKSSFVLSGPDQLWTDFFTDPSRLGIADNNPPAPAQLLWVITPVGRDVDYDGQQTLSAAYAMADLPLVPRLKLILGARYERTKISIDPFGQFGCMVSGVPVPACVQVIEVQPSGDRAVVDIPEELGGADIDQGDLLPSVNLVWEMKPNMNLRASWSKTIARPTFRELAPVATEEFIFGDEFVGNPSLQLSNITNYDLRWEWFRRPGEVLSASVFYKQLTNPIELLNFAVGDRVFFQPVNFETGDLRGLEFEARTSLDVLAKPLKDLSFGVNFTLLDSQVTVPDTEQARLAKFGLDEETRQLQGQPAYLFNVNLQYDNPRTGTSAAVFYNYVSDTLLAGAAQGSSDGIPDVYETPVGTLVFTFSQEVGKGWSIGLEADNLTRSARREVYRTPEGNEAVKSLHLTASQYALKATWSW